MRRKRNIEEGRYSVTAPDEPGFSTTHPGVALSLAITYASRTKLEEMTVYVRDAIGDKIVGRVERRQDGVILAYMDVESRAAA